MLSNPIPACSAVLRDRIRKYRTPAWRRSLGDWLGTDVAPALGNDAEAVAAVLAQVGQRLAPVLALLDQGPQVLDDRRFAARLHHALDPLTFATDIVENGATIRAYCDIGPTLALFDALLPRIAAEFSLDEVEVALRIGAASAGRRETLVFAGRRVLASGRHEEAAVLARRALDIMTACPTAQALLRDALRARRAAGGALTEAEENGLADLRGRFCPRPFEVMVSGQGVRWNDQLGTTEQVMGSTYACDCAAWLPFVTGNLLEAESPDAVWNSPAVQEVRRSILDGDFSYCSRTSCPAIVNAGLPKREDVTAPRLRRIIDGHETELSDGPRVVAFGHDSSCNLACPSCRHDVVMADREQAERLERGRDRIILPMLRDRSIAVQMTSWGDPFASRHYRSVLEALRGPEYDGVRLYLLTNGIGLTPHTWESMPHLRDKIVELRVSVDAASKETYEKVRRPGRWDVIRNNLERMGELDRAGTFVANRSADETAAVRTDLNVVMEEPYSFVIAFVVQRENFREMPDFVTLGQELGAAVVFQKYYSFGHESPAQYAAKDVTSPSHPDHAEFQAILHEIAESPNVSHAFLRQLETRTA